MMIYLEYIIYFKRSDYVFHEEILRLINLHHEGSYWDFKKQWYSDKCDLLHDIICMANNLENRDGKGVFAFRETGRHCLAA